MKAIRTSNKNSWIAIGANCANMGWQLDVALTPNEEINLLIKEGFEKQTRRIVRKIIADNKGGKP